MRKYITCIIVLICLSLSTRNFAQQDPQYTQYMYNMAMVNPAYAGSNDAINVGFLARTQWVGVKGAPKSFSVFVHSPVGKELGAGISLIHDKIGPVTETHAYADFSFTIKMSQKSKLAFGLKAGATFQQIGLLNLTQAETNDPNFSQNVNKTHPNFGFGLFYYRENFYIGASVPNILESLHFERSGRTISRASEEMHSFLTTGYIFDLKNEFKLKPSILAKYVNQSPLSLDVSLNILWKNKFEMGVSHRIEDSWSGILNFRVNDSFRIGYSYDYTVSNLSEFNSGSHELILLFDFQSIDKKYLSPRYF